MDTTKKKKTTKKGGEPDLLFQAFIDDDGAISFNVNAGANLVLLLGTVDLLRNAILTNKMEEQEEDTLKQIPSFNPKVTLA